MQTFLTQLGLNHTATLYQQLPPAELIEHALRNQEGHLSNTGALVVKTGTYTGRATESRFIVDTPLIHDTVDWGKVNVAISVEKYQKIRTHVLSYLQNKSLYTFDGFAGADVTYQQNVRVINELPSQNMFMQNLLLRPQSPTYRHSTVDITLICAPQFTCNIANEGIDGAAILLNIAKKEIIICGSQYSGEMKKAIFSMMNYLLPDQQVLPMHCAANIGEQNDVALFFGLSGTGKTTLSTDNTRKMIGDDEHGWSPQGIFNIEGGMYAKCLNLTASGEPQIYSSIRSGALVENVVMDPQTRALIFDDATLSENSRVGFPTTFLTDVQDPAMATHPQTIIFLTADAFGVLPPVSKLTAEQAVYHFLSGYTSKTPGTEQGISEPIATFSTCFGAPFLPRNPLVYAEMLQQKIEHFKPNIFLVNTGWSQGSYGMGTRMPLSVTRSIVSAILAGELNNCPYEQHPIFNLYFPTICPGVDNTILNPILTWSDDDAYQQTAQKLADLFIENFTQYSMIPDVIVQAGPTI